MGMGVSMCSWYVVRTTGWVIRYDPVLPFVKSASIERSWSGCNLYFQVGCIRERKDGMSEYSVAEVKGVEKVLSQLRPYIRLKQKQCDLVLEIVAELKHSARLSPQDFLALAKKVDAFEELNDSKKRTIKSSQVAEFMRVRHILIP
jgi:hypothetical protein